MSSKFNAYDYISLIIPGSVVVLFFSFKVPQVSEIVFKEGVSVGGLGVVLIASFVVGHVVQGFGNIFEKCYWGMLGGMPTNWVGRKKMLLSEAETEEVLKKLCVDMGVNREHVESNWGSFVRRMYIHVKNGGVSERVDIFNRNYGFLRGVSSSFLLLLVLGVVFKIEGVSFSYVEAVAILFMAVMCIMRMHRFSKYYAKELFHSYLSCKTGD